MKQDSNNALHFNAEEGKTFVQKETNMRFGYDLYLSIEDSIENYVEEDMTEEEKQAKLDSEKKEEHNEDKKKKH